VRPVVSSTVSREWKLFISLRFTIDGFTGIIGVSEVEAYPGRTDTPLAVAN
jgi:hypothetical protein